MPHCGARIAHFLTVFEKISILGVSPKCFYKKCVEINCRFWLYNVRLICYFCLPHTPPSRFLFNFFTITCVCGLYFISISLVALSFIILVLMLKYEFTKNGVWGYPMATMMHFLNFFFISFVTNNPLSCPKSLVTVCRLFTKMGQYMGGTFFKCPIMVPELHIFWLFLKKFPSSE